MPSRNYCITHGVPTNYDVTFLGDPCVIVSSPPPEVGLTHEEVEQLTPPSKDELILMDMNAEVLLSDLMDDWKNE